MDRWPGRNANGRNSQQKGEKLAMKPTMRSCGWLVTAVFSCGAAVAQNTWQNGSQATGLAHYNLLDTSTRLAGASIANALRFGIYEHYDSLSGKPLGVSGLGMSAVVLTMALDGLSPAHRI
jgi:hypothetical protein